MKSIADTVRECSPNMSDGLQSLLTQIVRIAIADHATIMLTMKTVGEVKSHLQKLQADGTKAQAEYAEYVSRSVDKSLSSSKLPGKKRSKKDGGK